MKRFYCVILAMLAVVLYAIVMSGCRAISSNVEVATQPVVETPLAEHIGKVRQGPFVNDAEEFVRNISVLLEEKSPHDYSVRRIEEILLNNGYLEEYFKGNTEPLALYCFEYIINHESLCYVSDNQNVSFSGNDKAIALIAWELMLTYDDTDLNYITSASSLENWLYFLRTGAPVNFILAESNIDDTYYTSSVSGCRTGAGQTQSSIDRCAAPSAYPFVRSRYKRPAADRRLPFSDIPVHRLAAALCARRFRFWAFGRQAVSFRPV